MWFCKFYCVNVRCEQFYDPVDELRFVDRFAALINIANNVFFVVGLLCRDTFSLTDQETERNDNGVVPFRTGLTAVLHCDLWVEKL